MKKLLIGLMMLGSFSIMAQDISGGSGTMSDPFVFHITGITQSQNFSSGTIGIKTNMNESVSDIYCDSSHIFYRNRYNSLIKFWFESKNKCNRVVDCLNEMQEGDAITIKVNRADRAILSVELPESCLIDPWAYSGDLNENNYI